MQDRTRDATVIENLSRERFRGFDARSREIAV